MLSYIRVAQSEQRKQRILLSPLFLFQSLSPAPAEITRLRAKEAKEKYRTEETETTLFSLFLFQSLSYAPAEIPTRLTLNLIAAPAA